MTLLALTKNLDERSWQLWSRVAGRPVLASVLLALVAVVSYLPGQLNLPAIDRTEGMVALSSRYVIETGDIHRPRWEQNVQRTRPVATFWAQALSLAAHDKARWNAISTYRLPSLLATLLAVLAMFWLSARLVGPVPALMASSIVAVTPIVALHAQLAIAEPLILPSIVITQLALLAIYRDPAPPRWWGWLGAFWLAAGLSLAFNALSVPLLALVTVAVLAAWDRRWDLIKRLQPWFGLPILAVLATPWLAAVWAIDGGTLYRDMGWWAILDALEGGQSMKFKTAYGVFVLMIVVGFVPAAHMLGPAVARFWPARHDPTVRFLLVWLLAPLLALEIFSNKPPLYTVQALFPAGALLIALAIARIDPYQRELKALPGMFVGTAILLVAIAPLLIAGLLWVTGTPPTVLVVAGYGALALLFIYAAWVSAHGYGMAWLSSSVLATFILGLWFNGQLMPGLANFWTAPQLSAVTGQLGQCGTGPVSVSGFREPSLALALRDRARIGTPEAAAAAIARAPDGAAIIESRQFDRFRAALREADAHAEVRRLGCVRSFNLARGCSLLFQVYVRAGPNGAGDAAGTCRLALPKACQAKHDWLRSRLKIKHCG